MHHVFILKHGDRVERTALYDVWLKFQASVFDITSGYAHLGGHDIIVLTGNRIGVAQYYLSDFGFPLHVELRLPDKAAGRPAAVITGRIHVAERNANTARAWVEGGPRRPLIDHQGETGIVLRWLVLDMFEHIFAQLRILAA